MARKRLVVLISGRGSNLQALIDAARTPDYPAEVVLVISNREDAAGLKRAESAGIATLVLDHRGYGKGEAGRCAFDEAVSAAIEGAKADFVCLAGFMRLLSPQFVVRWRGRLINIHPSLLPAFRGLDAHAQALAAGVKLAGCTVHFVSEDTDAGPIIGQAAVPVLAGDDEETLAARILDEEHGLYRECVRLLCEGKARLTEAGLVELSAEVRAGGALANPPSRA
jgi:phosphoribosylglycinamide formyltransferase-1